MDGRNQTAPDKGCFQWVLRKGRTINERWAKSRSNIKVRFHKNNPERPPVSASDLINDTGTPDMELIRIPLIPRPPLIGQAEFMPDSMLVFPILPHMHTGRQREITHHQRTLRELREIHSDDVLTGDKHSATPDNTERAVQDILDHAKSYAEGIIHRAEDVLKADTGGGDIAQAVKEEEGDSDDDYDIISYSSVYACMSSTASNTSDAAEDAVNSTLANLTLDSDDEY